MNAKTAGFVPRLAAVILLTACAEVQAAQEILQPGVPVTRSIGRPEQHRFGIVVQADELMKVTADQQDADVRLELRFAGEAPVMIDGTEKGRFGRELLLWVAPRGGSAELIVTVTSAGNAGRYTLETSISPGGNTAREGVALLDAAKRAQPLAGEVRDAGPGVPPYQRALDAWRAIGDREVVAACLLGLGTAQHRTLGKPADAVKNLTEALAIYTELGLHNEMAQALQQTGHAERMLSHADAALQWYERAYEQAPHLDPLYRAIIEDDIGRAAAETGELDRGVAFSRRAAETFHAAGARRDEVISLQRLATVYLSLRQLDDATRTITEAIELGRQYGRSQDQASLSLTAGRIAFATGDDDAALVHYQSVVDRTSDNTALRISALISMGRIYNARREPQRARGVLEQALGAVPPQVTDMWAAVASELGSALAEQGELTRALELQTKALDIVHNGPRLGEIAVTRALAATYRALGDRAKADAMTDRAAELVAALPGQPVQAAILRDQALNARAAGDLPTAREKLAAALALIDSARGRLQSEALRTSFGAASAAYFEDAIDVEMALDAREPGHAHDARAFELFERSRARSLVDLLSEAQVDPGASVDPALLVEQRAVQKQLGDKDTALRDLSGKPGARERIAALAQDVDDLERRLAVLDGRIRAANPHYAALVRPTPPSLADTQRQLDENTVLLAFAAGTRRSWGWAVTRDSIRSFALPAAAEIDARARRVYASLTARQRRPFPDPAHLAALDRDAASEAAALSDAVLGPLGNALAHEWRTRRLAIVATGALEYVPFVALPLPASAGRHLIVEQHEVVRLPSVATLALLRSESAARQSASTDIAVFADPVFGADDPRVARRESLGTNVSGAGASALLRGTDDEATRSGFARLVFSREEARAIAAFAPHAIEALDFNASLPTLNGPATARARILHFATHGILNSARPALSGIVLSLVDRSGRRQEGIVRLYDIFNLSLSAELVVLSGCQTGLGRKMKGEGLVGLTRAFMHAGVPRVMASLWEVDDRATAELMRRFYRALLVQKLRPAAALRAAQQQMRANVRWRSPYYWAAFALVGDWQ